MAQCMGIGIENPFPLFSLLPQFAEGDTTIAFETGYAAVETLIDGAYVRLNVSSVLITP